MEFFLTENRETLTSVQVPGSTSIFTWLSARVPHTAAGPTHAASTVGHWTIDSKRSSAKTMLTTVTEVNIILEKDIASHREYMLMQK
eukprot:5760049-Amphidinium_carterae.1